MQLRLIFCVRPKIRNFLRRILLLLMNVQFRTISYLVRNDPKYSDFFPKFRTASEKVRNVPSFSEAPKCPITLGSAEASWLSRARDTLWLRCLVLGLLLAPCRRTSLLGLILPSLRRCLLLSRWSFFGRGHFEMRCLSPASEVGV